MHWKPALGWLLTLAALAAQAVELTDTERRWLRAAAPVLQFARAQGLPLDIIVQPQPTPGETPLGTAFIEGRCKLVLSMRGNPGAQTTLDEIESALVGPVVESIAAHELGHCWRHLQAAWGSVPEGFDDAGWRAHVKAEHVESFAGIWSTRREEAYADLVGLAWTLKRHPARYEEVHAWYVRLRAEQALDTGAHDTRLWVRLARDRKAFADVESIFEQVRPLWVAGLRAGL